MPNPTPAYTLEECVEKLERDVDWAKDPHDVAILHHLRAAQADAAALAILQRESETRTEARLARIRGAGWVVAVHNDYRLAGQPHTFWLFTRGARNVKGEGHSDEYALEQIERELPEIDRSILDAETREAEIRAEERERCAAEIEQLARPETARVAGLLRESARLIRAGRS